MSPLFGKKKTPGTIAVLDIESGSVGSALVQLSPRKAPKLFAQERIPLTLRGKPSAQVLLKEIEREVERSLVRLSGVVSRVRTYGGSEEELDRVAVFLHAPWTAVSLKETQLKPETHDATLELLRQATQGIAHDIPATFHSFTTTTTPIVHGIFERPNDALVVSIGSELAEISLLKDQILVGYATVPVGVETLVRTIQTHAGISKAEARSILSLTRHTSEHAWAEAVTTSIAHLTRELRTAAEELIPEYKNARHVFIVSPSHSSDLLARTFTHDTEVHKLFAPGSTVRAVSYKHISPHLAAHPEVPDVPLMLESLFVDTRFGA